MPVSNYNVIDRIRLTNMDVAEPKIWIYWTETYKFRNDFSITINNQEVVLITNIHSSGGETILRLSAAQKTAVLSAMSTVKEETATFTLKTYSSASGSQLMGTSSYPVTLKTSAENSAPLFTAATYVDSTGAAPTITGDAQAILQSLSSIRITCTAATMRSEATLDHYEAVIGTKSRTNVVGSNIIVFGTTDVSGESTLLVSAVDSRGYSTTISIPINIYPYERIGFNSFKFQRINNIEADTKLLFSGQFSPIIVNNVDQNYFNEAEYRYKEDSVSGVWSDYDTLSGVTSSDNYFAFSANPWESFDPEKAYLVEILVSDALSSETLSLRLPKATGLVAFRETGVGIFNRTPQRALDVIGEIGMNGYNVLGYVRDLGTDNLNSITSQGIYLKLDTWGDTTLNYPAVMRGVLEVIGTADNFMQRITDIETATVYVRSHYKDSNNNGHWLNWHTL